MELTSHVRRSADTRADVERVYALLADVPSSVAHFPEIESLTSEGGAFHWRLKKLGAGPLQFQVHYAARYSFDPVARAVRWDGVPGVGNTKVDGRWIIEPRGAGARFTMETSFTLDLPFPKLMRGAVEAILQKENERIIGEYLGNLVKTLDGGDGRVRR